MREVSESRLGIQAFPVLPNFCDCPCFLNHPLRPRGAPVIMTASLYITLFMHTHKFWRYHTIFLLVGWWHDVMIHDSMKGKVKGQHCGSEPSFTSIAHCKRNKSYMLPYSKPNIFGLHPIIALSSFNYSASALAGTEPSRL